MWRLVKRPLETVAAYWLALNVAVYGAAKLSHTQFTPPALAADARVGSLSGFVLVWVFFGHSRAYGCFIGAVQLGGAVLVAACDAPRIRRVVSVLCRRA